jgi:hypothetical protein
MVVDERSGALDDGRMDTQVSDAKRRQFFWGLSTGIVILGVAGAFWVMLAATSACADWGPADRLPGAVRGESLAKWSAVVALPALAIAIGGLGVRRKAAGFSRLDLRRPELIDGARAIQRRFRWVSLVQFAGCGLSAWLGTRFHREDLIWPGIGLVVSLHFAPFGFMFRMRPYLVAAVAGTVVAILALLLPVSVLRPAARFAFIGIGVGAVVWITAVYAILHADRLAETWASGG